MLSEEVPHLQASFDPTVVFGGVTQYIVWMVICWIITLVLILVVGRKLTLIPTNKFVNTVEYGYQFVRNDMGEGIIVTASRSTCPSSPRCSSSSSSRTSWVLSPAARRRRAPSR